LQDRAGLDEIARAMEAMEKALADGAASVEPDFEFHLAIARATRNRFSVISLEALRAPPACSCCSRSRTLSRWNSDS
jgi:DNA-binding FadR family transcriptional regulator